MNIPFDPNEIVIESGETASAAYIRILNNFHQLFRVGDKPNDPKDLGLTTEGQYRSMSRYMERLDIVHNSLFSDVQDSERLRERQKHSALWLLQTDLQFFEEIDRTIKELGHNPDAVAEAINDFALAGVDDRSRDKKLAKLFFLLAPIYAALRKKGYTPRDLTA